MPVLGSLSAMLVVGGDAVASGSFTISENASDHKNIVRVIIYLLNTSYMQTVVN